jgi:hypothetical protein
MFDYIRSEVPLPDGFAGELQTKDFSCEMVTHVITKDGELHLEQIDSTEIVPKSERPYPDEPEDSILAMCGMLRSHKSRHKSEFHGWLKFYGSEGKHEDGSYQWHEYRAKYTDGKLVKIDLVETDN